MRHVGAWAAFVLVHAGLAWLNLTAPGLPLGDVELVYVFWVDLIRSGYWVGIDSAWVYPILAAFPMLASAAFGNESYALTWLLLVTLLNAVAFALVLRRSRTAAWWWIAFLVLVGPIALGRIDSITVPLAIVGALIVGRHPIAATVVLTVAAWIKVWPAAIVGAFVIALRERARILGAALGVSGAIVAVALLFGSGLNVFSFVTQQTGRGLQIEAPVSTWWLWVAAGGGDARVYYDREILTWQVTGSGVAATSAIMTPVLVLVVLGLMALGVRAARAGVEPERLLPPLTLAFVTALIAFNKVGSPQFITWLAVAVILGLVSHCEGAVDFRVPAAFVLVIGGLTHVVYPYLYGWLLSLHPAMLIAITLRNALELALLAWAARVLWRLVPRRCGLPSSVPRNLSRHG